jgi:hypothetical protein
MQLGLPKRVYVQPRATADEAMAPVSAAHRSFPENQSNMYCEVTRATAFESLYSLYTAMQSTA